MSKETIYLILLYFGAAVLVTNAILIFEMQSISGGNIVSIIGALICMFVGSRRGPV